jgi:hypothetical protein
MNPVEAGLCRRPENWPWSSHSLVVAGAAPDWMDVPHLLTYLAAAGGDARRSYDELFVEGLTRLRVEGTDPVEG